MRKVIAGLLLSGLTAIAAPIPIAHADNPAVNTSVTDNYAYLTGSATSKQGFQSAGTSTYLSSYTSFTVEAWLNPADTLTTTNGTIFAQTDTFQYQVTNGTYQFIFNSGGWKNQINTGVYARIGEWQHVAYVKNGNTFSLYLNGSLAYQLSDATNVPTTLNPANSYTSLGSNPWSGSSNMSSPQSQFFAGGMDEVRVWTTARTQSDIQNNMNIKISPSSSNLASYWDFNGTTSTSTIYDRTGLLNFTTFGTPNPSFPDIKSTVVSVGTTTVTFPRTYLNGTGGYQLPAGVTSVSALVVGGGGAGGFDGGGGGGGGGVYQNSNLAVAPLTGYEIIVGGGGAAKNGYTGGSLACNGAWSGTVIGCIGSTGGTSKFGAISASGGGGGGGVENSGTADSDASATVRGGGGGAGGQNSRSGGANPGVGAFSGGSVTDVNSNGGGGGASGTTAGSNVTTSVAGNGAAGITATLNSLMYGSGGAGGSFASATVATGGTGAANGGTTGVAPTTPLVNRGGGGAGGGNGSPTATNAYGSSGAAGVIILQYAMVGSTSISFGSAPAYRVATVLTATTNVAGKVTFYANNKRIPGCVSIPTSSLIATCNWKPSLHGSIAISTLLVPTDSNYLNVNVSVAPITAPKRVGSR
jgi:hypothetical protein